MTDLRKAAEMALEALIVSHPMANTDKSLDKHSEAMSALRQALAQPEQEKESTVCAVDSRLLLGRSNNFTKETENRLCDIERRLAVIETQPALAQPEQGYIKHDIEIQRSEQFIGKREWVGLTEEEVDAIRKEIFEKYKKALFVTRDVTSENDYSAFNFYRAIEEKLRIKND